MPKNRDGDFLDCTICLIPILGAHVKSSVKKVVGASALGAISIVELLHLQQASATPVTFTGSTVSNPKGGSVQVAITVDGASGTYRITSISTPVQPGGQNAAYANIAIPTLTNEALAAQSASINGVSGASEVSAAWKSSLSSAIAQAAAAGEAVGTSSAPAAPATPTTPNPNSSGAGTVTTAPAPLSAIPTSVAVPPTYYPFYLPPYTGAPSANLAPYFTAVSTAISRIATAGSEGRANAIANAQAALSQLQSMVNQSSGSSDALNAYISNANAGMQYFVNKGNQDISDYYVKVAKAANQLYLDVQASAAAIKAEPAPTVTVTVTATATVTATPKPTPSSVIIKPGGVIKKTFSCIKTLNGVTTTQVVKAFIVKCPAGFTLKK